MEKLLIKCPYLKTNIKQLVLDLNNSKDEKKALLSFIQANFSAKLQDIYINLPPCDT